MGGQQVYCPHCNTAVLLPTFEAAPPGPNRPGVSNSGFPGAEELAALSKAAAARTERRPQSDLPHEPPTEPRAPTKATRAGDGSILIPGDGGGYIALREPSKTIAAHGRQIELRRLSPEEKARRRFRRNWLVAGFGLVFLVIALLAMGVLRGGL